VRQLDGCDDTPACFGTVRDLLVGQDTTIRNLFGGDDGPLAVALRDKNGEAVRFFFRLLNRTFLAGEELEVALNESWDLLDSDRRDNKAAGIKYFRALLRHIHEPAVIPTESLIETDSSSDGSAQIEITDGERWDRFLSDQDTASVVRNFLCLGERSIFQRVVERGYQEVFNALYVRCAAYWSDENTAVDDRNRSKVDFEALARDDNFNDMYALAYLATERVSIEANALALRRESEEVIEGEDVNKIVLRYVINEGDQEVFNVLYARCAAYWSDENAPVDDRNQSKVDFEALAHGENNFNNMHALAHLESIKEKISVLGGENGENLVARGDALFDIIGSPVKTLFEGGNENPLRLDLRSFARHFVLREGMLVLGTRIGRVEGTAANLLDDSRPLARLAMFDDLRGDNRLRARCASDVDGWTGNVNVDAQLIAIANKLQDLRNRG